jgi:hypothetical protein
MPDIVIVNACDVLTDIEVSSWLTAIQSFDAQAIAPAYGLEPANYSFMPWNDGSPAIASIPDTSWPIFLNKHSTDPGALGWHDDQSSKVFSRCFVGDCIAYKVSPLVDLTHEAWEMRGDPNINVTVTLLDGRIAARELCDPCEDDLYAIDWQGFKLSDFVLPPYFGIPTTSSAIQYDFGNHLPGPCPALLSGGYQSIIDLNGQWTQITARQNNGHQSWRATRVGRNARRAGVKI